MTPYKRRIELFDGGGTERFRFLSKQETQEFLKLDADKYVKNMTELDLYARKVTKRDEYLDKVAKAAVDITKEQQVKIKQLAKAVDLHLTQSGHHKIASVPWNIAATEGSIYENGYPHTRDNVIFLSTNDIHSISLGRTLMHEKVHVYQRLFPEEIRQYLKERGYKPVKLRKDEPFARSNPDLDEWIYLDPVSTKPMVARYSSDKPSSISDVTLEHPAYEHPHEKMAYDIASSFV